jgi:hypothetical protein
VAPLPRLETPEQAEPFSLMELTTSAPPRHASYASCGVGALRLSVRRKRQPTAFVHRQEATLGILPSKYTCKSAKLVEPTGIEPVTSCLQSVEPGR